MGTAAAESPGDLIYLAPHRWDSLAQRPQHLAAAFAALGWRVLVVEPVAYSVLGNARRLVARRPVAWRGTLTRRGERLWSYAPPPGLPLTMEAFWLDRLGHRLARRGLVQAVARLGFRRPALVVGWPLAAPWVGRLGERIAAYDCMDDFPAFPQARRRQRLFRTAEHVLAQRIDLAVATSEPLRERWQAAGFAATTIPNGVPAAFLAELVHPQQPPADLAAIPAPRLLYIGTLDRWLDRASLIALARRHPEWSLVLVGPAELPLPDLAALPNVHLLGSRPHAALPAYLANCAAGLIPFVVSPLTIAVNPVKLYEYLGAGLPVVATPLPEIAPYGALCYLGVSGAEFIAAAERAMAERGDDPRRQARRAVASEHTWDARARAFTDLLVSQTTGAWGAGR